jgi:hypothetical protein
MTARRRTAATAVPLLALSVLVVAPAGSLASAVTASGVTTTMPAAARGPVAAALARSGAVAPAGVLKPTELTSTDPSGVALFGSSVAVLGNTLVVGAKGRSGAGPDQGAVFVFTKPASGWSHAQQVAELYATDGAAEDELGFSVAMTADTIVATALYKKVGNNVDQGAIYVWNKPHAGWQSSGQNAELVAGDGGAGDQLDAIAMSENTIVAGAFSHKVSGHSNQGAAYVFTKPMTGWADTSTSLELQDPGGAAGDEFGLSVGILGNTVYVGSPGAVVTSGPQGAVYAYTSSDGSWSSAPSPDALVANNGAAGDELGVTLAISGRTLVTSAPERTVGSSALQGAVYVFEEPAAGWPVLQSQTAMLTQTDGQHAEQFGASVAVSGSTIVAGALQHVVDGVQTGVAYDFTEPAGGWADASEAANLVPTDGAASDLFGYRVAISSDAIFVGAEEHNTASQQGVVYAFGVPKPVITALGQSHRAWRAGRHAAVVNPKTHRSGGTTFSFRLNDPATVSLRFSRHVGATLKSRGALTFVAKAGATKVFFDGVISATRTLSPGRYTVTFTAKSSGGVSTTHKLGFTIDKAKHH